MPGDFSAQLAALAERASQAPEFFAAVLAAFQRQENLTREGILKRLQTTPELLARLALCRRPKSDSASFCEDIRKIADFTDIDPVALVAMVRQVDALEALSAQGKIVCLNAAGNGKPTDIQSRLLAAARDRERPPRPRQRPSKAPHQED
jgi:hypothetical protein